MMQWAFPWSWIGLPIPGVHTSTNYVDGKEYVSHDMSSRFGTMTQCHDRGRVLPGCSSHFLRRPGFWCMQVRGRPGHMAPNLSPWHRMHALLLPKLSHLHHWSQVLTMGLMPPSMCRRGLGSGRAWLADGCRQPVGKIFGGKDRQPFWKGAIRLKKHDDDDRQCWWVLVHEEANDGDDDERLLRDDALTTRRGS